MPHRYLKLNKLNTELVIFILFYFSALPYQTLLLLLCSPLIFRGITRRVFTQVGNVGTTVALLFLTL